MKSVGVGFVLSFLLSLYVAAYVDSGTHSSAYSFGYGERQNGFTDDDVREAGYFDIFWTGTFEYEFYKSDIDETERAAIYDVELDYAYTSIVRVKTCCNNDSQVLIWTKNAAMNFGVSSVSKVGDGGRTTKKSF